MSFSIDEIRVSSAIASYWRTIFSCTKVLVCCFKKLHSLMSDCWSFTKSFSRFEMSSMISFKMSFVVSVAWCSKVAHSLLSNCTSFLLSFRSLIASLEFLYTSFRWANIPLWVITYVKSIDSVLDWHLLVSELAILTHSVHNSSHGGVLVVRNSLTRICLIVHFNFYF